MKWLRVCKDCGHICVQASHCCMCNGELELVKKESDDKPLLP